MCQRGIYVSEAHGRYDAAVPQITSIPPRKGKHMKNIAEWINGVWANDYHFENITDLATAALVRAVLWELDEEHRQEVLERIVSSEMRVYVEDRREDGVETAETVDTAEPIANTETIETMQIPRNVWIDVNKALIVELINKGKNIDTSNWTEASHNIAYKKTVKFLKYDFLPNIDGAEYVKKMPDELARFLTDCWLSA